MFTPLETKRLYLKNIDADDTEFFYKEFSTDGVNMYLYDADPCESVEDAREWVDFYLEDGAYARHRWIIVLKENSEKIGTCGFHCWDRECGEVEIGYDLQPAYWRQGIMTEAIAAMLDYAKSVMRVKKVFANIFVENIASVKTAEKAGFAKSGEQYYEEFHGKKYLHDVYVLDIEE